MLHLDPGLVSQMLTPLTLRKHQGVATNQPLTMMLLTLGFPI
jgi:hypothetical protein